jgi:hypothetical protein
MNNLVHCADGRTPYQALTGLDPIKLDVSNFHAFGCPCYVLDHRFQSGNSIVPKREPRYVQRSPSHAANVALIFNPRTGHVSPQFHGVFDDDFTTVPYLHSSQVPPFWADLVCASTKLHVYTKRQVDTWQSLPELTLEISDFTSEQTEIPNVELGTSTNKAPASSLEGSEGVLDASTSEHTSMLQVVSFQDQNASGNNNPQPNEWAMPESVDLHKSGLRRSSCLVALHSNETIAAYSTLPIKQTPFKAACLMPFSLFCSYGMGTMALAHTHQTIATQTPSFLTTAVNSFH